MEVVSVLNFIAALISLTEKFKDLISRERVVEKDKDGYFGKLGELLDQLRLGKDIDSEFEYFSDEALEGWLSQLRQSPDMTVLESVWRKIYERFEKHIIVGVENQLPRIRSLANNQSTMQSNEIPPVIRNEVANLTQLYPELIHLIEEFIRIVQKQNKEIEQKNFKNIGETASTLDRQIKRIKMRANTLLRDLCSIIIYIHDQLRRG